jgi:hypothetical protein
MVLDKENILREFSVGNSNLLAATRDALIFEDEG